MGMQVEALQTITRVCIFFCTINLYASYLKGSSDVIFYFLSSFLREWRDHFQREVSILFCVFPLEGQISMHESPPKEPLATNSIVLVSPAGVAMGCELLDARLAHNFHRKVCATLEAIFK